MAIPSSAKKCAWLLHVSKLAFIKSSHIIITHAKCMVTDENFGPLAKTGPPGLILAAKSGPPLPISVPPTKSDKI